MWGKIILKLHEQNSFILHAVCGGIGDVILEDDKLVACSDNEIEIETISANIDIIQAILNEMQPKLIFEVRFVESLRVINQKNIQILKSIFGEELIVK